MKQIMTKVDTKTGIVKPIEQGKTPKLYEGENNSTKLVFNFDRNINKNDKLVILFKTSNGLSKGYRLERIGANRYSVDIPREVLTAGKLNYTIQHYDEELLTQLKYVPSQLLTVNKSLDITQETLESRPDLFAELLYRVEQLEKNIQ